MADLTREGLNNQKRKISVNVSEVADTKDNIFFQLPQNIITTAATVIVLKADSTSGATMDIVANGTSTLKNEVKVDTVDTTRDVFETGSKYFDTGALIEVKAGDTAPAGDGEIILVVEYIELDRTTGEYTPYPEA